MQRDRVTASVDGSAPLWYDGCMKRTHLFLLIGLAAVFVAGYAFFLLQQGTKGMPPSMIEHAAIAPLGSSVSGAQKIQ